MQARSAVLAMLLAAPVPAAENPVTVNYELRGIGHGTVRTCLEYAGHLPAQVQSLINGETTVIFTNKLEDKPEYKTARKILSGRSPDAFAIMENGRCVAYVKIGPDTDAPENTIHELGHCVDFVVGHRISRGTTLSDHLAFYNNEPHVEARNRHLEFSNDNEERRFLMEFFADRFVDYYVSPKSRARMAKRYPKTFNALERLERSAGPPPN